MPVYVRLLTGGTDASISFLQPGVGTSQPVPFDDHVAFMAWMCSERQSPAPAQLDLAGVRLPKGGMLAVVGAQLDG